MLKNWSWVMVLSLSFLMACAKGPESAPEKKAETGKAAAPEKSDPKIAKEEAVKKALDNVGKDPAKIAAEEDKKATDGFVHPVSPKTPPVTKGLKGEVTETMDAAGYTYVRIKSGMDAVWLAGPATGVEVGDTVFAPEGALMRNFKSGTLKRTFPEVYFVQMMRVTKGAK
jgi:hypothetical protein